MNRSRLRFLAGALLLALGASATGPARAATPDALALLTVSDAIRNPPQPFRVTVVLTEFEKGSQVDSTTLTSYARVLEGSGQFATVVRFVEPARDAGKLMLKNGKDLWFYDPGTKSSVRISPQQRLMGEASNGDVITVAFARDYKARYGAEETVTDGERKPRKAHKLLLAAASDDATYAAVELWVDAENARPIKARFLADSGRLLKTAYYRRFQPQLGAERPTETVIIDGLNPQQVTVVRLSDFAARDIPPNWFQRDHLPQFGGD
jgi:outer membrane lipoprotein-sorting protein